MFDTLTRMGASNPSGYEIERSLRFNDADTKLSRTFGTNSSNTTKTLSFWMKRGKLGTYQVPFSTTTDSYVEGKLRINNDDTLQYEDRDSSSGSTDARLITTRKFRDTSAWYHIVLTIDTTNGTAGDRVRIYVNGVRDTSSAHTNPASSYSVSFFRSSVDNWIGVESSSSNFFDGYLAEVNFVDGTALDASSFGETNDDTGEWIPKKYAGSYGTNGFYLNFSDNSGTTATTLGKDSAGSNNWTPNNFSVAAGVGNDSMTDTPTNNHATLTPLKGYGTTFQTPTNGNLDYNLGGTTAQTFSGTAVGPTGKWYFEVTATSATSGRYCLQIPEHTAQWDQAFAVVPQSDVREIKRGSSTIYSSITSISDGDIIGIALDCDNNTAQAYMNGTSLGNAFSLDTVAPDKIYHAMIGRNSSGGGNPDGSINFGQRAFSHQPAGFKAWNTANLPDPTIKNGRDYFNSILYTANATTDRALTGVGFSPNLFWAARRNASGGGSMLFDTVRGATKEIYAPYLNGEDTVAESLKSFDADGVTLGNNWPNVSNGDTWVAWNWKESVSAGFDIITYEGDGVAGRTVAHNLGVAPNFIVVKDRDASRSWAVGTDSSWDKNLRWEDANGLRTTDKNSTQWYETAPTSSVFYVGDGDAGDYSGDTNVDGENYIAYVFSSVSGYSKAGYYEGIGGTDGPYVVTGFRPAWVLIKNIDSDSRNWIIKTAKIPGYNVVSPSLATNNNYAEESNEGALDFLSNGFKIRNNGSYTNESGSTHIYLAFAESPFKYANAR